MNQDSLITSLKDMSHTMVIPIMGLSINAIELLHAFTEVAIGRFDCQMVVIIHQAVGMDQPIEGLDHLAQDFKKCDSVVFGYKYGFLPVASRGHMIKCAHVFDSKWLAIAAD